MNSDFSVGIALAVYNPDLSFLELQIQSLREQKHQNWICFVSDDSAEEARNVEIQRILAVDPRFRYGKNQNGRGVLRNFENALRQLGNDFDFYCFCDQDDLWERDKLSNMIQTLSSDSGSNLAHSDLSLIDRNGDVISSSCWTTERRRSASRQSLLELVLRNSVTGCSLMFKKNLLQTALPFPANLSGQYLHDHWLACMARCQGNIIDIPQALVRYRQHGGNVVGAAVQGRRSWGRKLAEIAKIVQKSQKAFEIRRKLAKDILEKMRTLDSRSLESIQTQFSPLLKPEPAYFLKGLLASKGQWPEFGLWLQLVIGSICRWFQRNENQE